MDVLFVIVLVVVSIPFLLYIRNFYVAGMKRADKYQPFLRNPDYDIREEANRQAEYYYNVVIDDLED